MRKLLIPGALLIIAFEIARVYFIMPMPGSQTMNSLSLAYLLHSTRWIIRFAALAMILAGFMHSWQRRPVVTVLVLALTAFITYVFNFRMSADTMFHQPDKLIYTTSAGNKVSPDRLVIGVHMNGESKAWPLQFIAYHHQVRDSVGGIPVMVTYCSVCRTGRVYSPMVKGKAEKFRLVGMDHFNAMFEDVSTGSWWRQVNGECVAGELKGQRLKELLCSQVALSDWLDMHPDTKIMQADPGYQKDYDDLKGYDEGTMKSSLEGTDTGSWKEKSWVLGTVVDGQAVCWDWRKLSSAGQNSLVLNGHRITATILPGGTRFMVERHCKNEGTDEPIKSDDSCRQQLPAYQEFWHSWRTFHPGTMKAN